MNSTQRRKEQRKRAKQRLGVEQAVQHVLLGKPGTRRHEVSGAFDDRRNMKK